MGGILFVLWLNPDRTSGILIFSGNCGGYSASFFPNVGCKPGASGSGAPTVYTQEKNVSYSFIASKTLNVNFDVTGFTPTGNGTLELTLNDDFYSGASETAAVTVDGLGIPNNVLFNVADAGNQCSPSPKETLTIPLATLQAAAADGTVMNRPGFTRDRFV